MVVILILLHLRALQLSEDVIRMNLSPPPMAAKGDDLPKDLVRTSDTTMVAVQQPATGQQFEITYKDGYALNQGPGFIAGLFGCMKQPLVNLMGKAKPPTIENDGKKEGRNVMTKCSTVAS